MSRLFKTASFFQTKLAQTGQDMLSKIQKAMATSSAAVKSMEIYDPGYDEVYSLASKLYNLWRLAQSEDTTDLKSKIESQLPTLKALTEAARAKVDFETGKSQLSQLAATLNSIVPVDLVDGTSAMKPVRPGSEKPGADPTALNKVVKDLAFQNRPLVEETEATWPSAKKSPLSDKEFASENAKLMHKIKMQNDPVYREKAQNPIREIPWTPDMGIMDGFNADDIETELLREEEVPAKELCKIAKSLVKNMKLKLSKDIPVGKHEMRELCFDIEQYLTLIENKLD